MRVVKRLIEKLKLTDYTTPGIASRIMDTNIITLKKLLKLGKIPFIRNTTFAKEAMIRIKDMITYCIRNNLPIDYTVIDMESIPQHIGLFEKIYCYAHAPNQIPDNPIFNNVNLKQLILAIEFDPFQPVCIGNYKGDKFQFDIAVELKAIYPSFSNTSIPFTPTLWRYKGSESVSAFNPFGQYFDDYFLMLNYVERHNEKWKTNSLSAFLDR